jgi:hypothetical protein
LVQQQDAENYCGHSMGLGAVGAGVGARNGTFHVQDPDRVESGHGAIAAAASPISIVSKTARRALVLAGTKSMYSLAYIPQASPSSTPKALPGPDLPLKAPAPSIGSPMLS